VFAIAPRADGAVDVMASGIQPQMRLDEGIAEQDAAYLCSSGSAMIGPNLPQWRSA
jgi:hypothetical protein